MSGDNWIVLVWCDSQMQFVYVDTLGDVYYRMNLCENLELKGEEG